MNKNKQELLPEPEAGMGILRTYIDGQDTPFYVHGQAEVIEGLYEAVKNKTYDVPVEPVKAVVEAPVQPEVPTLAYGFRADVTAKLHDVRFGTNFLQALRDERQLRKDLAMAEKLGLLTVEPCLKHRKGLEAVKAIR